MLYLLPDSKKNAFKQIFIKCVHTKYHKKNAVTSPVSAFIPGNYTFISLTNGS